CQQSRASCSVESLLRRITLPLCTYVRTSSKPARSSSLRSSGIETRLRGPRLIPLSSTIRVCTALSWSGVAARLRGAVARPAQQLAELLAGVADRIAEVAEGVAEALGVVRGGIAGVGARSLRLVARDVGACCDAVVVSRLHPLHQLVHALDRQRVGEVHVSQQAREAVERVDLLAVVLALPHEHVEV